MINKNASIENIEEKILQEKKIVEEIISFFNYLKNVESPQEKERISSQLDLLFDHLRKYGEEVINYAEQISLGIPLNNPLDQQSFAESFQNQEPIPNLNPDLSSQSSLADRKTQIDNSQIRNILQDIQGIFSPSQKQSGEKKEKKTKLTPIEKFSIKRQKKKERKAFVRKKDKKPSKYVKTSSELFYDYSMSLLKKNMFRELERDMIKGNINHVPAAYISMLFFSTLLSIIAAVIIIFFLSLFSLTAAPPFIAFAGKGIGERLLSLLWIIIVLPAATFLFVYFYPYLERKSIEKGIDQEIPFATIHMSAISSSMIEPSKIFKILISTGEYPYLEKEFIKLQNEINIYGYDLVTALRHRSFNSPSRKLSELFNGLSTTITSGGNLPVFFDKRSQSLLFEHRLEMEKKGKAAETFMDVYISVVITAPMVIMLLLMMMSIGGLGIALSPGMISLLMILGVSIINILFLMFLHLRQANQ